MKLFRTLMFTTLSAVGIRSSVAAGIETLPFDLKSLPVSIQVQGKIVDGVRWRDLNGENLLVLTQTGKFPSKGRCPMDSCNDAEVYAYHYVIVGNDATLLWKLFDYERNCPVDLYAGFVRKSLSITDLNSNGIAESTLVYKLSCRSDVSPAQLKVIMHEGKEKYAIRGETKISGMKLGGKMTVDPALEKAGDPFKRFGIKNGTSMLRMTSNSFEDLTVFSTGRGVTAPQRSALVARAG